MIFVWGKKHRRKLLGTVADWCDTCERTERFDVTSHYEYDHIYGISIGKGKCVATVRLCWECGSKFRCHEDDYDAFLPEQVAEILSTEELLDRTNTRWRNQREAGEPRPSQEPLIYHRRLEPERFVRPPRPPGEIHVALHWLLFALGCLGLGGTIILFAFENISYNQTVRLLLTVSVCLLAGHGMICLHNYRRWRRANWSRKRPDDREGSAAVDTNELIVQPRKPRAWAWVTGFLLFALAPVSVLTAEIVRTTQGWPANSNCYPPVVGPGDEVRIYFPQTVRSAEGHWRATPTVEVQSEEIAGLPDAQVHATSANDQWGATISGSGNNPPTNKHVRLWMKVQIPDAPDLSNNRLPLQLKLKVSYPQLTGRYREFKEVAEEYTHQTELQLGPTGKVGARFHSWVWLGLGVSAALCTFMGVWVARLTTAVKW
jgi:hypothetical protein